MGVKYKHYCSDMTRTFLTKPPTNIQEKVYNTVLEAQKSAINKLKAGNYISQVRYAAWHIIKKAGFAENFQHALGHGIGLDIHELPNLGVEKPYKLLKNTIITIEPGIYIEKIMTVFKIIDLISEGYKSIAVICKTPKECKSVNNELKKNKQLNIKLLEGKEEQYDNTIVIVPSYLSKGLEFDAVIIINIDDVYNEDELDLKLLYVAMTRAQHKLFVYYKEGNNNLLEKIVY